MSISQLISPSVVWMLLGQAPTPAPGTTPGRPAAVGAASSVWDMVLKGGWVILPIAICSIVAITIIVERLITTRRASVAPPQFLASVAAVRDDARRALDLCSANSSPASAVLAAAIKSRGEGAERRDQLIREAGQRQIARLRLRTRLLSALPQTATMLGLLGTVIGMIRTFTVIAASGESLGKTERLAHGIYEAWTATAAGLIVAIPVLVMYHIVMGRIDTAAAALDKAALDWLEAEGTPVTVAMPQATPGAAQSSAPPAPPPVLVAPATPVQPAPAAQAQPAVADRTPVHTTESANGVAVAAA